MKQDQLAEIPMVIVGCGAISQFFYVPALKALSASHGLRVAVLVDPSFENLNRVAAEFPDAKRCTTIEDAGVMERNLVIIASPPRFHAIQTIFALRQGAAVLCEKPMAASVEDAEKMIVVARDAKGILAIGLYRRFFPATEAIRGLIENGVLGKLQSFRMHEGGPFGWQAASESFFRRSSTPGGVLYDTGVHVLDLLLWWLGEPTDLVYEDDAMGGLESNCRLRVAFSHECAGEVCLSRDWKTANCYIFYFERGFVRWTVNDANHLEVFVAGLPASVRGELIQVSQLDGRIIEHGLAHSNPRCFIEQIRNVAAAKRGLESIKVPPEQGIRSLRLIEMCYRNRRLMKMPWMTPNEETEAQRLASACAQPAFVA
jgi:predicted dehydrogenase